MTERATEQDKYQPTVIEPKWQATWETDGLYKTDMTDESRPKHYFLTMYPYPSGNLHVGHWYAQTPADAAARYLRMRGNNVFFPMGFDAFGLPAENAAIKAARDGDTSVHPHADHKFDNTSGNQMRLGTPLEVRAQLDARYGQGN